MDLSHEIWMVVPSALTSGLTYAIACSCTLHSVWQGPWLHFWLCQQPGCRTEQTDLVKPHHWTPPSSVFAPVPSEIWGSSGLLSHPVHLSEPPRYIGAEAIHPSHFPDKNREGTSCLLLGGVTRAQVHIWSNTMSHLKTVSQVSTLSWALQVRS